MPALVRKKASQLTPVQLEERRKKDRDRKKESRKRLKRARDAKKFDEMLETNNYFNERKEDAKK